MIRNKGRNIVLHAAHQMQTLLREPRDGETSHVLLTLNSNPIE